ncbi:MAG TPA: hypothetical protein PKI03_05565 [Pseudomonadota bacterium]|nr:hypothetical protein [Pseudomonadota bacterium]
MLGTYTETGHEEHCPDINGPGCAAQPAPAQWHSLKLFFSEVRLSANYGLLDWLSADLMWSLRIVGIWFQLQDLARKPIDSPYGEEIHHRTETLVGLSDPWLSLRAVQQWERWALAVRLGVTLPVGATVENPFRLGREGQSHQHIQFGTGTVNPFSEVEVQRQLGRFTVSAWMLSRVPLYANHHGYQAGPMVLTGVRALSDLWLKRWHFTLGALVYHEKPERWDGVVETEGNLGRTDLMLEAVIAWRFTGQWTLGLSARFPVWSHVTGAQLSTPAIVELSISRPFQLTKRSR